MKSFITAVVSLSLIASPALVQATPAPSQAATAVPASERVDGQQALASSALMIIGGVVLLGAIILLLVLDGDDDDDLPASP